MKVYANYNEANQYSFNNSNAHKDTIFFDVLWWNRNIHQLENFSYWICRISSTDILSSD